MRFLHKQIGPILDYIRDRKLTSYLMEVRGKQAPRTVDLDFIRAYADDTAKYLGAAPIDYILVMAKDAAMPTVGVMIADIEGRLENSSFVLIGYNDGGVISVSNHRLPCQVDAQPAEWWKPP